MWMDVAQEIDPEPDNRSDDEDTVYDRNSEGFPKRHEFTRDTNESRGMLDESDTRFGIGTWRPEYLQKFVNRNSFVGIFVFTGILHGSSWAYFTSTISTMEKRMKITSETTGALLAGNELAQLIISIIFSYFAIRSNRMKFLTLGASLWAFSCFILVSHQIFFGSGNYALSLTRLSDYTDDNVVKLLVENPPTTLEDIGVDDAQPNTEDSNVKIFPYINADRIRSAEHLCIPDVELLSNYTQDECGISNSGSSFPISFILFSQIISGVGTMFFLSSGGPYVEDTIMPDKLPIIFGITLALRLVGPFLGYVMASAFLKSFISTVSTPLVDQYDPRWMGAWWLGWLVIGIFMTICAILLSLFPRQMAREYLKTRSMTTDTGPGLLVLHASSITVNSGEMKIANTLPTAQNFMRTLMIFFNNNINLYITISAIFHVFVATGYWTFYPKYLEVVFKTPPAKAAILTGSVSVMFNAAGLILSGVFISKFLPSSDRVAFWRVLITSVQIIILIIITQFGCESGNIVVDQSTLAKSMPANVASNLVFAPRTQILTTTTTEPTTIAILSSSNSSSTTSSSSITDNLNSTDFTTNLPTTLMPSTTTTRSSRATVHLLSNCSADCGCVTGPMLPMCDEETGRVFYNPCLAGCQKLLGRNENGTIFGDCSCISENSKLSQGFCQGHDSGCFPGFVTLLILTSLSQFINASGVIGSLLIFYRSVPREGRRLINSLGLLLITIFAIIPGPIIFGTIIDAACHIWEHTCAGTIGHCWHYNNKNLRYGFNLAAAGFLCMGLIFDVLLWRDVKMKDVRLYDGNIDHSNPEPSTSGHIFNADNDTLKP